MIEKQFLGEFIGTVLLIFLGNGVVANCLLDKTKGKDSGLLVIAAGWAIAVFVAVTVSAGLSGAHLNPAVTIALTTRDILIGTKVLPITVFAYIFAQLFGAMFGQFLVYLFYKDHHKIT